MWLESVLSASRKERDRKKRCRKKRRMRVDIGGLGQEQGGRFMASWHFLCPFLPVSLEKNSVRLTLGVFFFFLHDKGLREYFNEEEVGCLSFKSVKLGISSWMCSDDCFKSCIKWLRLFPSYKNPFEKLVWEREGWNGLHVKVLVLFTLTLTKLILLGRVWVRHDVHRLKLFKYECSETRPIRIAGAPHVP